MTKVYFASRLAAVVLAAAPGLPTAATAATLSTTAQFNHYSGDIDLPSGSFEAYINDVVVPPFASPQVNADGFPQGELVLPPGTTSVEFKNRQINLPSNEPNMAAFAGAADVQTPSQPFGAFKLVTITVTNGIYYPRANFDFTLRVSSDDPFFDGRRFDGTLRYVSEFLAGDPVTNAEANADYFEIEGWPKLGKIRVFELASGLGNTGTVDLYGRAGSLIPLYFANATGGVFIQAIPEPATWAMLAGGLMVVAATRRCAKTRRRPSANLRYRDLTTGKRSLDSGRPNLQPEARPGASVTSLLYKPAATPRSGATNSGTSSSGSCTRRNCAKL